MTTRSVRSLEDAHAFDLLGLALDEARGQHVIGVKPYWASGFTPDGVRHLRALADQAVALDTCIVHDDYFGFDTSRTGVLGVYDLLLSSVFHAATDYGADYFSRLLGWAEIRALATDSGTSRDVIRMIDRETPADHAEFRAWLDLGSAGPLAYAAGLLYPEAHEQITAGTLDVTGLPLLAALRGHVAVNDLMTNDLETTDVATQ